MHLFHLELVVLGCDPAASLLASSILASRIAVSVAMGVVRMEAPRTIHLMVLYLSVDTKLILIDDLASGAILLGLLPGAVHAGGIPTVKVHVSFLGAEALTVWDSIHATPVHGVTRVE